MGCAPWNELENNVCFIAQKDYKISDRKAAHRGRDFHIWAVLGCFGLFWAVLGSQGSREKFHPFY